MVGSIILVALGAYASASAKSTAAYESVRDLRYAGDGAIKAAIDTVRKDSTLAVDPAYGSAECLQQVVTNVGDVTVSCEPPDDASNSGVPPHQGIDPPEALLLLGARHNEPGPYSAAGCERLGQRIGDWWAGYGGSSSENAENSLTMRKIRMINPVDFWSNPLSALPQCNTDRSRGDGPVTVQGTAVVAGWASAYPLFTMKVVTATGAQGTLLRGYGCGQVGSQVGWSPWLLANCTAFSQTQTRTTGVGAGSLLRLDPGRKSAVPAVGEATDRVNTVPINDITDAFLPIGFDGDGTLRDGYDLPARTTAYVYDPTQNTTGTTAPNGSVDVPKFLKAVPGNNCANVGAGTPIIFLPGWYKSSEVLSSYTANPSCPDRTFWFAPNAGDDLELLTPDDVTAAFYMDFRQGSGRGCGTMTSALPARWCLGGAGQGGQNSNSKPRVVVGTPEGWTPFPATTPTSGSSDPPAADAVNVVLDTANAIDTNWLSVWSSTANARAITVSPAAPELALFEPCPWVCWSLGERSLRLADFGPKSTAGPVAEPAVGGDAVVAPKGRVYIDFAYRLQLGSFPDYYQPAIEVDALDDEGVTKECGAFDLSKDPQYSAAVTTWTTSAAQARQVAENCGSVDMVNNLRVHFKLKSTNFWSFLNPGYPKVEIDGARIRFKSYTGASFPVGTDGLYASQQPAKGDCDDTKAGGQLIFGGESHVYAADGSLEICGGPDPDDPAGRMVTGIYGVPAVESIAPTGLTRSSEGGMGENDFRDFDGLSDSAALGRMRIGEPAGRSTVSIRYDDDWFETNEGRLKVSFPALSVPSGYKIGYVDARVSWDSNNPAPGLNPIDTNSQYWQEGNGGNCKRSLPTTAEIAQAASIPANNNFTNRMFTAGGPNCLNVANSTVNPLSGGLVLTYAARGKGPCLTDCGGGGTFKDYLDGIELDVGLLPADDSQPRLIPQSGCITAHANYFAGAGTPDCALLKADSFRAQQDSPREDTNLRGNWIGRASVKGAIYAPSAAIEYDDNDVGYPLASRGIIARHLLITGAKTRQFYADPMIGGLLDRVPATRTAVFTACTKDPADPDPGQPCGQGSNDRTLTQAEVRFEVALSGPADNRIVNWVPVTTWWTDRVAG